MRLRHIGYHEKIVGVFSKKWTKKGDQENRVGW